jgi:hypothetical protein
MPAFVARSIEAFGRDEGVVVHDYNLYLVTRTDNVRYCIARGLQ